MKMLVVLVLVAGIGVVFYGYSQDWFTAKVKNDGNQTTITGGIDKEKFQKDTDAYLETVQEKLADLQANLDSLKSKAKDAKGDTKEALDKEIAALSERKEKLGDKLSEMKDATAEKWEELKSGFELAFSDLKKGFQDAVSRFK
ncbi:MAG: hypothetical protein R3B84_08615 [Zavarzinella sp.]